MLTTRCCVEPSHSSENSVNSFERAFQLMQGALTSEAVSTGGGPDSKGRTLKVILAGPTVSLQARKSCLVRSPTSAHHALDTEQCTANAATELRLKSSVSALMSRVYCKLHVP